jgi:hypothetical protein
MSTVLPRPDVQVSTGSQNGESEASIVVTPAGGKPLTYTGKGASTNDAVKQSVEGLLNDPKIIEALPAKQKGG